MFGYNKIPNVYAIGSFILMVTVCRGTPTVSNGYKAVAVIVGSRSTLTCSTSAPSPVLNWKGTNGQYLTTALRLTPACVIDPQYADQYNVSAPPNGSYCNLIILNATADEAGSYACADGALTMVNLIVLNLGPHCSTDSVHNTVVHPGQVTMNCSVQYNSSSGWTPSVQWNTTGSTTSGTSRTTAYSTVTYYTSASTPIPSYSCSVVYNSSVYVDFPSCSTNPVTVLFTPRATTISGAPDGYITPGSSLICSASGSPSPTYQWFNSTNNLLTSGPSLTVWNQDNYTCIASNIINGYSYSDSASVYANFTYISQTTTQTPPTTQTPATTIGATVAVIVLGILFAVSLIVNLVLIILLVKRNHSTEEKPRIYEEPQNTNTPQEASSTMYTSLELPTLQEGSEMRERGKQSIYEVPLNNNVEPEASSTMYTPLELPGKQGGASKNGLYETSSKTP